MEGLSFREFPQSWDSKLSVKLFIFVASVGHYGAMGSMRRWFSRRQIVTAGGKVVGLLDTSEHLRCSESIQYEPLPIGGRLHGMVSLMVCV